VTLNINILEDARQKGYVKNHGKKGGAFSENLEGGAYQRVERGQEMLVENKECG